MTLPLPARCRPVPQITSVIQVEILADLGNFFRVRGVHAFPCVVRPARVRVVEDLLAARARMSEHALDAGFRRLYGQAVFEVLRDERLAHARLSLATAGASIKQIARRVGYSHVSNFTAAFTRRYGEPPMRYSRERSAETPPAA